LAGTGRKPGARSTPHAREDWSSNQILKLLPRSVTDLLLPDMDYIDLRQGETLFEPGDKVAHTYFPLGGAVFTLILPMSDGQAIEAATIGREGAIGGIVSLGLAPAYSRATTQIPGPAARISIRRMEEVKRLKPKLHDTLARYADCLTAQVFQSVGCATLHTLEERCARWLLMMHDRLQRREIPLTQERLAEMFGVARTYVTRVAQNLQKRGGITYHRGIIRIEQRSVLAESSCECYGLVRRHFERVLPGLYPRFDRAQDGPGGPKT